MLYSTSPRVSDSQDILKSQQHSRKSQTGLPSFTWARYPKRSREEARIKAWSGSLQVQGPYCCRNGTAPAVSAKETTSKAERRKPPTLPPFSPFIMGNTSKASHGLMLHHYISTHLTCTVSYGLITAQGQAQAWWNVCLVLICISNQFCKESDRSTAPVWDKSPHQSKNRTSKQITTK